MCGRWRHALKKNVFSLNARVEEYTEHRSFLNTEKETAREIRLELYGDPREGG